MLTIFVTGYTLKDNKQEHYGCARQIFLTGLFPAVVLGTGSKHLYQRGFAITTDNCNDSFL